jgi:hypothetical protein
MSLVPRHEMGFLGVITFTVMSMAMLEVQGQEVRHATITVGNMGDT